jgi:hypothetical protein
VNEVEVQIVELEVAEAALHGGADVRRPVIGIPQLGRDPQILPAAGSG